MARPKSKLTLTETLRRAPLLDDELISWAFGYVQNVATAVIVIYAGVFVDRSAQTLTEAIAGPMLEVVGLALFLWNAAYGVKKILLLPTSRPFAGLVALLVYLSGGLLLAALFVSQAK